MTLEGRLGASCDDKCLIHATCLVLSHLRDGNVKQAIIEYADGKNDKLGEEIKNIINLNALPGEKFFLSSYDIAGKKGRRQIFSIILSEI